MAHDPHFRMRFFMDEFDAAGLIPASRLRWELTAQMPDDVRRMLAPFFERKLTPS